jgi:virulence factor Mce-like protein
MAVSRKYEIGVGLLLVVAMALFGWSAIQIGAAPKPGHYIRVSAALSDAGGLSEGAVLSVAGVQVGRLESLTVDFDRAQLELSLDASVGLRQDVQLRLRARSVLGEKYLQLVPISRDAPLLQDGDVIQNTQAALEIDQLLSRLEPIVDSIDPSSIQQTIDAFTHAIEQDPERPARMLAQSETLLSNLSQASEQLPALIQDTRSTLSSVRQTSQEARPVLARADRALASVQARIDAVPPDAVPGLLTEAESTLQTAQALVEELQGKTDSLDRILHNLEEIDKWELRRLLREEGILLRLKGSTVDVPVDEPESP